MRGLARLLCCVLVLWLPLLPGHSQGVVPTAVTEAGLRTVGHRGGFRAAAYLPDGTAVLLEDQGDGLHLLKVDATLSTVLAESQRGAAGDHGVALAADGLGNVYVGGTSSSGALEGTPGAAFAAPADTSLNSFIAKYDRDLRLVFLSFLGSGRTALTGIAATHDAVFATGVTYSAAFPATPGAVLPHLPSGNAGDGFVECLAAEGATVRWATYLGGPDGSTSPAAIAADASDAVYVTGSTASASYPVVGALQANLSAAQAGFLSRLAPDGSQFVFSTFIAGAGISSLAVDPGTGNLLLTGNVSSGQFPVANAFSPIAAIPYQTLLRISPDGQDLRDSVLLLPGDESTVTPAPNGTAWITGSLSVPLASPELLAGPGDSYALHLGAADIPDALLRFGGQPTNHPSFASLQSLAGPAALNHDGSAVLLPSAISAGTDAEFAGTQVFDLALTGTNNLLPSGVGDLLPSVCDASLPCSGTGGLLLQLGAPVAAARLAFSLGDAPNVLVRNLGPASASGLRVVASTSSLVSDCLASLSSGAQCGLVLGGSGPTTLTASAADAASISADVPATGGASVPPLLFSVPALEFGLVSAADSPATRTVIVTNLGTLAQTFTSAADNVPPAAAYTLSETASTCAGPASGHVLAAGASCSLTVGLSAATVADGDGIVRADWKIGARDLPVVGYAQASSLTLSSATIDFEVQSPRSSPPLRFLYLSNATSGALPHATVEAPAGSPFQVNDDCPSTLQPQSVCQIGVLYNQPSAPALDSLQLELDEGLSVLITGETTGSSAASGSLPPSPLIVTPTAVLFTRPEPVSSVSAEVQVVQVTNSSSASVPVSASLLGEFLLGDTCPASLPPGASCDLGLRFAPAQTGTREGLLTLSAGGSYPSTPVPISGTGSPLLDIAEALDLGETPVGEPVVRWFQLQGSTQQQLTVTAAGAGFGVALLADDGAGHGTLSATSFGAQATAACLRCWVAVQFVSQTGGAATGLLTARTSSGGNPLQTTLSAIALPGAGLLLTPAQANFGAVPLHSRSAPLAFVLTNQLQGSGIAHIQQIEVSDDFVLDSGAGADAFGCAGALLPSASCRVEVAFAPGAQGPHTGLLTIVTDAGSVTARLAGIGTHDPGLSLSPTSVTFGPQTQRTVTLTDTGASQLTLGPSSVTSPAFRASSQCATLGPGQSCTVVISYLAGASGTGPGALTFPVTSSGAAGQAILTNYAIPLDASQVNLSAALSLFPTQADFGIAATGSLGPSRQFTVTNSSTTALTVSLEASHNFPLAAPPACRTLAAGASCSFAIVFLPETAGALVGSLTVQATAPGGTPAGQATLYLRGYGLGEGSSLFSAGTDPAHPLSFGTVASGQTSTQVVTLTNQGITALSVHRISSTDPFQATSTCVLPLPPGGSCQVNLTYQAGSRGSAPASQQDVGTVFVESDAGSSPDTVYLTGGVAPTSGTGGGYAAVLPVYSLHQTALTFPNTPFGQIAPAQEIVVSNPGTVPVRLAALQAPPDFPTATDCGVLQPGATCRLHVSFQPDAAEADELHAKTLALTSDGASALEFISLLGTSSVHPLTLGADTLQFGEVPLGASASLSLQITNGTILPVPLGQISFSGEFSLSATTCALNGGYLAAGQACTLTISFQPVSTGELAGQLTLPSGALAAPLTATLAGEGVAGQLAVTPAALAFGTVDLSASATLPLTLANTGKAPLGSLHPTMGGADAASFTFGAPCGESALAPGESCTLAVSFLPRRSGEAHAVLTLSSSDPAGATTVPLTGTGAEPPGFLFTVNGAASAEAQVGSGGSASFSLKATPRGGYSTPLSLTCTPVHAAPNTTCTLSSSTLSMNDGAAGATLVLSTLSGLSAAAAMPWGGLLLAWPWMVRRQRSRVSRFHRWIATAAAAGTLSTLLGGCGDGPGGVRLPYTPPGVYTYSVSATPTQGAIPMAAVTVTLTVR